jgi:uroporphyrinogen-III synthase
VTPEGPLAGIRVVVTRARGGSVALTEALEAVGATVIEFPTIEIVDPESWEPLDTALKQCEAGEYEWIVFASVNAVDKVFARLEGNPPSAFSHVRVAAVGPSTAGALTGRGVEPDLVPARFTGEGLTDALGPGFGRLLFPRAADAPRALVDALMHLGWAVDEVTAYRNILGRADAPEAAVIVSAEFHFVTFTSASTAGNFAALIPPRDVGLSPQDPPGKKVVCIGPSTARAAREVGLRVDAIAEEHTIEGLVDAVIALHGIRE